MIVSVYVNRSMLLEWKYKSWKWLFPLKKKKFYKIYSVADKKKYSIYGISCLGYTY